MKTLFNQLVKVIEAFIFVLFTLMVIITFLQVVFRFGFNFSLKWAEEFARFSMIWIGFLGAALVIKDRGHTKVDYFIKLLPKRIYPYVNIFINFIIAFFLILLMYHSIPILQTSMKSVTPGLGIIWGFITISLPVGSILMIIYLFLDSVKWYREGSELQQ